MRKKSAWRHDVMRIFIDYTETAIFFAFLSFINHGRYAIKKSAVITSAIMMILSAKFGGSMSSTDGVDSGRAIKR